MKRLQLVLAFLLLPRLAFSTVFGGATPSSGSGSSISFSHTVTAGPNLVLVACIQARTTGTTFSSITYAGVAMASHQRLTDTNAVNECYKLVAPATGSNTFAATLSGSTVWTAVVADYSSVDQTTPLGTAVTDIGINNGTSSVVVSSATGDIVFDSIAVVQGPAESGTLTIGASQTSQMGIDTGPALMACASSREAGAASVTMSWTWAWGNENLAHIAFNIKSAPTSCIPCIILMKRRRND